NLFGARRKNSLSSKGAKNTFTKFNLEFQHKRFLPLDLQTNLKFNSQLSSTRLTPQERFSLGGINTVRGYPEGDYSADNAFLINLELLFPAFFIPEKLKIPYARHSLKKTITPLIFFDYGYGRVRESGAAGGKTCNLRSAGVGFKIRLFNQAILRLEWGFPLGDKTIGEAADSRFHFSVVFEDKFPEEIERIKKIRQARLAKKEEKRQVKQQALALYRQALSLYKKKKYMQAYKQLEEIQNIIPAYKHTNYYLKRILKKIKK
ncbi:MAG: BamA/TamA family outer membrane protein, partial [Candidatus Omnitrophica bacterium]|nr:BamA/TamA family outer membrane protein [Candidatus Omnitrophota bacterium]